MGTKGEKKDHQHHRHNHDGETKQVGDWIVVNCTCGAPRSRTRNPGGNKRVTRNCHRSRSASSPKLNKNASTCANQTRCANGRVPGSCSSTSVKAFSPRTTV